jgi:Zn ribbon nucleic-acid-binding protein
MGTSCPRCYSVLRKVLHTREPIVWRGSTITYRECLCLHCGIKYKSRETIINEESGQSEQPPPDIIPNTNPFLPPP